VSLISDFELITKMKRIDQTKINVHDI
jgi:hypothetical protein